MNLTIEELFEQNGWDFEESKVDLEYRLQRIRRSHARAKADRKYRHVDAERNFKSYQAWKGNHRRFAEAYRRKNPRLSKHLAYNLIWFW